MAISGPAGAYVRARTTETFVPFFWAEPRQPLEVARPPSGIGITDLNLRDASLAAIRSWSYPKIPCTAVSLRLEPGLTDSQVAGRDGINRIIMRVGTWCRDPFSCICPDPDPSLPTQVCHDANVLALTTVISLNHAGHDDDGKILEADIEVNAVGFPWAIIPPGPISGQSIANSYDLTSVLTHETGHFIGLDHTCMVGNARQLIDDQGFATDDCFALPPDRQALIEDATMYPQMNPADIKLRTLTDDDSRAACEIYPGLKDDWGGGGGCALSSAPVARERWGALIVVAFGLTRLLSTRARKRRDVFLARNSAP